MLEELGHAEHRGARIYAELLGYGRTNDAHGITAPLPDGRGAARALAIALDDASVRPDQVDYLNAHATGTVLGDEAETRGSSRRSGRTPITCRSVPPRA